MKSGTLATREQRESPRFAFAATVMFENNLIQSRRHVFRNRYSRRNIAPHVGTEIFIGIEKSPCSSTHDVFRAKVMWLREFPLKRFYYSYSVGVKYY